MTKDKTSSGILAAFSRQPVEIKAGALTLAAGLLSLAVPNFLFEKLSVALGIAKLIPAAAPPIGYTGRAAIALMVALLAGIAAYLYFTGNHSRKHRQRFDLDAAKADENVKPGKSLADRLRRGIGDTLAPKATQWDAKPADADFKPLDVERDLGARFDESPYLQDSNLAYGEVAAHRDDGGIAIDPAMTPIPAPPHAEYPELELDPASRLSDPQWRVRPVEELRETMLDLNEAEAIGPLPGPQDQDHQDPGADDAWMDLGLDAQSEVQEIHAYQEESFSIEAPVEEPAKQGLPNDSSVQELLARLEGALVERAARRAQMRLETQPAGAVSALDRSESDMGSALKDALAALQNASRRP